MFGHSPYGLLAPSAASATEPVATPPAIPVASPAVSSTAATAISGLPAETPWFQRFLLPVPEASGPVDDWLSCYRPRSAGQCRLPELVGQAVGHGFRRLSSSLTNATASPAATESLDFDRANGFRGGVGYRFGNGWNVAWTYTYFRNANAETATANPTATGNPELIATQSYLNTDQSDRQNADEFGRSRRYPANQYPGL